MSGTIEVADPVLSTTFHAMNVFAEGICSTRIDFQLGTNGGNTSGLWGTREALHANSFHSSVCLAWPPALGGWKLEGYAL